MTPATDNRCPRCDSPLVLAWKKFVTGEKHIARTCPACRKARGFAPKTDANVKLADAARDRTPITHPCA